MRRLAGDDPEVNEEWNCDKGRWAFTYTRSTERITTPLVRRADGTLGSASWSEALRVAAAGLSAVSGRTGVLVGGRLTLEDAYAYSKFARTVLATNDIDFRVRPHSSEEAEFLAAHVAGQHMTVTYSDLESASAVLLAGFEPEEESPIVFLRLRKAARKNGVRVLSVAPFATRGLDKMSGRLIRTAPGDEATTLNGLAGEPLLRQPGAIIMVGERLAAAPGALSAASRLATVTGAQLTWVPRRAGERGAVEAGALPNLLPGGRPCGRTGRDTAGILGAVADGTLRALLVGAVEIADLPDPRLARRALAATPFVVSLELLHSEVTDSADVVFPVASVDEKSGTFLNWEGRHRSFSTALDTTTLSDLQVLQSIAAAMGVGLGLPDSAAARAELARLGPYRGPRPTMRTVPIPRRPNLTVGQATLSGWRMLLDRGRMQDGEPRLAGTARTPVVRLAAASASEIGARDGDLISVRSEVGTVTLPLCVTDMPERVVWLPLNSPGCAVGEQLGVTTGAVVGIGVAK